MTKALLYTVAVVVAATGIVIAFLLPRTRVDLFALEVPVDDPATQAVFPGTPLWVRMAVGAGGVVIGLIIAAFASRSREQGGPK
jgi:hypothetical protein